MNLIALIVLMALSLASFASGNRLPAAQQVAVLFADARGTFAWPILTLSKDGSELSVGKFGSYACADGDKVCERIREKCNEVWSGGSETPCPIGTAAVKAYHRMERVPKKWFGPSGQGFAVSGGVVVPFAFGQGGEDLVGFSIRGEDSDGEPKKGSRVLADRPEAIRPKTVVSPLGKDWLAIGYRRIAKWKEQELASCAGQRCKAVSWLAERRPMDGRVITYSLSGGRSLQYFRATTSVPKGRKTWPPAEGGDYLIVEFWRLKDKGGNWNDLQSDHGYELGVKPEHVECVSQCSFEWSPGVVEAGGRTFVIGEGGRGEVFGYYFYEVVGSTLKLIGDYTGGS